MRADSSLLSPFSSAFISLYARIRLFGVDTPGRGQPCFNQATQRFKELAGDTVRVEFGSRQEDRYGRILYYVYTDEGESIDETLAHERLTPRYWPDGPPKAIQTLH